MSNQDFAVLAGTSGMTVTLPPASNATGQIVFIKNISTGSVTVNAHTNEVIEAVASHSLSAQFDSVQLISNGKASPKGVWYILSTAT
jgi:hypothetical protein